MKYSATPPPSATTLIRSSGVKPCQTARLYSGVAGPSTARTAVSRTGPTVSDGDDADDETGQDEKLGRKPHQEGRLVGRARQVRSEQGRRTRRG